MLPRRAPFAELHTTRFRAVDPTASGWFAAPEPPAACGWFEPAVPARVEHAPLPSCEVLADAVRALEVVGRIEAAQWVAGWARACAPMPAAARG